jgi:hypothetical protein
MTRYLAGVLTVIAVGVLLIAYGLLSPTTAAFNPAPPLGPYGQAFQAGSYQAPNAMMSPTNQAYPAYTYPTHQTYPAYQAYPTYPSAQPVRTVTVQEAPVVQRVQNVEVRRQGSRDWKKTALVIGGSTATGAGVGALVGGKKGALIGAAIGGGASTLYESTK